MEARSAHIKIAKLAAWLAVGWLVTMVAGCGGGDTEVTSDVRGQSIGRELMDFEEAYEKGTISEEEYQKLRQDIIEGE